MEQPQDGFDLAERIGADMTAWNFKPALGVD
jgi:hypothetical protein